MIDSEQSLLLDGLFFIFFPFKGGKSLKSYKTHKSSYLFVHDNYYNQKTCNTQKYYVFYS